MAREIKKGEGCEIKIVEKRDEERKEEMGKDGKPEQEERERRKGMGREVAKREWRGD